MITVRPLIRHTVRWVDVSDEQSTVNTTVYLAPAHHEDRKAADERNETEARNVIDYNDACSMGRAMIVEHVKEADDGKK
jgi:hypothetical protein